MWWESIKSKFQGVHCTCVVTNIRIYHNYNGIFFFKCSARRKM